MPDHRKIIWGELLKTQIPRAQPPEFDSISLRTTGLTDFFLLVPALNSGLVKKNAKAPPSVPEQFVQPDSELAGWIQQQVVLHQM